MNAALSRRDLLLSSLAASAGALLPLSAAASAQPAAGKPALPVPASLAAELAGALRRGRALVVMVSLEGCPPCRLVRQNYLAPLLREGQPVVEIDMLGASALAGFGGAASTQRELSREWKVRVAPTVLFFGRGGREAAPRLTGLAIEDFYGAYLQERIDAANRAAA